MKHKGIWLLAAILAASLSLMGCGSIMLNANLAKAKVKDYVPRDENGNAYYNGGSDAAVPETLGTKLMLRADREKYQIGGTDAFYLLPSGVPVPEGLISFKVLDLLDEKTTVYAYQSIYQNDDKTGLGGLPESGVAKEYEEVLSADNMNQMVTILMTYNTETKEYHVLFHQVDDVDVKIRPYDGEMSMRDQLAITKDGRDIKEVGSCFSQKLANGCYMIYYDGVSRVYDRNGKLETEFDVEFNLKLHHFLNGVNIEQWQWNTPEVKEWIANTNFPEYTITNVVMDSNYFVYVLLTVEKPDQEVSKDMDEDDLENQGDANGSGGSAVNQQLVTFFSLDFSTWTFDYDSSGNWKAVKNNRKFVSENLRFEEQKNAWLRSLDQMATEVTDDGVAIFDLGTFDEDTYDIENHPGQEEVVQMFQEQYQVPTAKDLGLDKGTFAPFEFRSETDDMTITLYRSKIDATKKKDEALKDLGSSNISDMADITSMKGLTPDLVESGNRLSDQSKYFSKRVFGKLPDQTIGGKTYQGKLVILPYNARYMPMQEVREDVTRRYRLQYSLKHKDTGEVYYSASWPIRETYSFIKEYQLELVNANAQWYDDRVTSDMIAPSAGTGIVRYNSLKSSNYEDGAWAVWQTSSSQVGIEGAMTMGTMGKAKNCMLFLDHNDPVMVLMTDQSTVFVSKFATYENGVFKQAPTRQNVVVVPNGNLYYGLTMEDELLDTIEQIKNNPEYDTGGSEEFTYSATDLLGLMLESGMRFAGSYVYLASADSGLVKVNLAEKMEQRGGQVSPYPYFGVWLNDAETIADTIGFQSSEYEYNNEDISRAKIYKVSLFDQDATVNLVLSAIEKDSDLSKKILNGDDASWKKLISELGLNRKEADVGQINRYYEFLKSGQKSQDNAVLQFYELAGVKDGNRTEKIKARILECRYPMQLEELMCELRPDILLENGEKPLEEETTAETSALSSTEESSSKIPYITDKTGSTDQASEVDQKQEEYRSRQGKVNLVASYLREKSGKTQEEWDIVLSDLVEAFHPSSSLSEYEKKMAVKDFASLAGYQVQSGMEDKIKSCTSVEELKQAMAWYYLPSTTRAVLQEEIDAKNRAAAEAQEQETTEETKSGYTTGSSLNIEFIVPGTQSADSGTGETKRQMTEEELKEYYKTQNEENAKKLAQAKQDLEEAFEIYCKPSIIANAEIVTGAGTVKVADQSGFGKTWNAKWDTWLAENLLNIQKILKTN